MAKGTIGILTGGGDVPGLNPAIRAITIRAVRDGYNVVGIRHGWGGLVDYSREKNSASMALPPTLPPTVTRNVIASTSETLRSSPARTLRRSASRFVIPANSMRLRL